MISVSAPTIEGAALEHAPPRFSVEFLSRSEARIETFLEAERGQLPLWFAAAFAAGIAAWLWLPGPRELRAWILVAGVPEADRYLLGLDPHAPDTHSPLASALTVICSAMQ